MGREDQIQLQVRACLSRTLRFMLDVSDNDPAVTGSSSQPLGLSEHSTERQKD